MNTVLWISAVGGSLLFLALAALVGLMYLLTAPWLFPSEGASRFRKRQPEPDPQIAGAQAAEAESAESKEAEQERRRRAVALVAAIACAGETQMVFIPTNTPNDWRHMHRASRLRTVVRQRG